MNTTRSPIAISLAALTSAAWAQPYLEFSVYAEADSISGMGASPAIARVGFVVNAADPTQSIIESTLRFQVNDAASVGPELSDVNITDSFFQQFINEEMTFAVAGTTTQGEQYVFNLTMAFGPPNDPDGSLEDDADLFTGWTLGTGSVNTSSDVYVLDWTPEQGFGQGRFFFTVREVPNPEPDPAPECLADLTGDGQLDFFDLSAYLQLLQAGCP